MNMMTKEGPRIARVLPSDDGPIGLFDLPDTPPAVLDALPASVLMTLHSAAAAHMAEAAGLMAIIHGVLDRRYAKGLNATGTTHRTDGDIDVKITVPKNVSWDAGEMAKAIATLKEWGENPAEYVDTKITVSEAKYKAWPATIRDLFTPARTEKAGKPKIELSRKESEVA